MLKDLVLHPVYDSEKNDLISDLQVPLLAESIDYLRGVGFFTSGWLRLASRGLVRFIENGGKARFVVSPNLQEKDWTALQLGDEARTSEVLQASLAQSVCSIQQSLERDTLNALAWMVAQEVLEFKFAIPRDRSSSGMYHDKVGVFTDANGDCVAIHGSLNDSMSATVNGEAFSVFRSWDDGQAPYVQMHSTRLEMLWDNRNMQFSVHQIPDAVREQLIKLRSTSEPPYTPPSHIQALTAGPKCSKTLYDFQTYAVAKWREAGCRGLFEMATGTGKTVTSLAAATMMFSELGRLTLIVLVPYLHLLEQWESNCRDFGFEPLLCSGEHGRWQAQVKSTLRDFRLGTKKHVCIIAVHKTASTERFASIAKLLQPEATMLIGDEAHGLGAPHLRQALVPQAGLRLGLSATPRRWFDDEGTACIISYFGPTCFEFTLEEAIGKYLTPYEYLPQLVSLTDQELQHYEALTQKLTSIASAAKTDNDMAEQLRQLLIRRSRIISGAQRKVPALVALLKEHLSRAIASGDQVSGILIYCAPGTHREVLRAVANLGIRTHEFVHSVGMQERETLLKQFSEGDIQALVAVRCLDEGVDVPSTRTAYILASSTNPREFIQRRGRILRLAPGKHRATVYDFIVVPAPERMTLRVAADVSILRREMPRFAEFSSAAVNQYTARATVRNILDQLGMLHLLEDKPWDVYHTLREWDWSDHE